MKFEANIGNYPAFPFWDHCGIKIMDGVIFPVSVLPPGEMAVLIKRDVANPKLGPRAMPLWISRYVDEVIVYPKPNQDYDVVAV
jgi:hypothetical protein